MPTVIIPRSRVTAEEIAESLRQALGDRYNVLPGMSAARKPMAVPEPAGPDAIFVGTGSNRLFKAQLTINSRTPDRTEVRIRPGGLGWETIVNSLNISRKVRRMLTDRFVNSGDERARGAARRS